MEWISAVEAVRKLGGKYELLRGVVGLRLQLGLIRSRADHFFVNGVRQWEEGDPYELPPRFWNLYNLEGHWGAGDFHGGGNPFAKDSARYAASGVKLAAEDIESLRAELGQFPPPQGEATAEITRPIDRPRRAKTIEQRRLRAFFEVAAKLPNGLSGESADRLRVKYEAWNDQRNKDPRNSVKVATLKRTAFEKWLAAYIKGEW
jgi:hypothetical protein